LSDRTSETNEQSQPSLVEELAAIPYEPLLPVEKWLIGVSLILGVTLLAILSWTSATFFPVGSPRSITGSQPPSSRAATSSTSR
jgi:hypothetical protein